MNITNWLNDNNEESEKTKILQLLSEKKKSDEINLLEYSYILNFLKSDGSIINAAWFKSIIDRLNSDEIKRECYKALEKIVNRNLEVDLNRMLENFIIKKQNVFNPTSDQQNGIIRLCTFLVDHTRNMFGFYGYAGTGKTTTICETLHYLLKNKYIKSVAFTAPTNKAVNICKSKFKNHLTDLYNTKTENGHLMEKIFQENKDIFEGSNINFTKDATIDEQLDQLQKVGIKVDFTTIHRLLNYKNDFDMQGERIFVKGGKNLLGDYDVVIVDECSMAQLQIIVNIIDDINKQIPTTENYKKMPKVIFIGDPAQLPPTNETCSSIFIKKYKEISTIDYLKSFPPNESGGLFVNIDNGIEEHIKIIANKIIEMECIILKQIVRNSIDAVNNLCNNIRAWINKEIDKPTISKFADGISVVLYRKNNNINKTKSKWFKHYLSALRTNSSNIILAWRNTQVDAYNNEARNMIFKGIKEIGQFEVGDVLILNDFYNLDEGGFKRPCEKEKDEGKRFYTSEQIKIISIEQDICSISGFAESLSKSAMKLKNVNHIQEIYKKAIRMINKKIIGSYQVWKLSVNRLIDIVDENIIPETYVITVINNASKNQWEMEKNISMEMIKKLRLTFKSQFREQLKQIDNLIIKPLWREWSKVLNDQFANVNYGFAITTHKSQGSTFYNVYVDADDILDNDNNTEAKRCIYTAFTRASNILHILI
jgi:hypothetical protein